MISLYYILYCTDMILDQLVDLVMCYYTWNIRRCQGPVWLMIVQQVHKLCKPEWVKVEWWWSVITLL
jgi:hypothetical protein